MGIDSFSNVNPHNFPLINANQKAAKCANQMDNNINNNNNKIQGPLLDPLGSTQIKRKRERERVQINQMQIELSLKSHKNKS